MAGALFGEAELSLLAKFKFKCHLSWQAQYLLKFKCHFLWLAQYLLNFGMIAGARMLYFSIENAAGEHEK